MIQYTIGCVPYVNAVPLARVFEESGDSPVRVIYDVPSRLPALLESGEAHAILVSSVDALRHPGRRMAAGVCIGSDGPVKSVRLFARTDPSKIRSLALDESSMTSNRLAQIVLKERFGITPDLRYKSPNLADMLNECDACVLIGDIGMSAPSLGLEVLDLGEEWRRLTGKPFVWAAWIGGDWLTPELARLLNDAAGAYRVGRGNAPGLAGQDEIIDFTTNKMGWDRAVVEDYYMNVMVYRMDHPMLDGLREFQRRLVAHGFEDCCHFPEVVEPA